MKRSEYGGIEQKAINYFQWNTWSFRQKCQLIKQSRVYVKLF